MNDFTPYRPSSGTEGMDFMYQFCDRCKRDAEYQDFMAAHLADPAAYPPSEQPESCPIIIGVMLYEMRDERYPKEWVYRDGHPVCTAFEQREDVPCMPDPDQLTLPL